MNEANRNKVPSFETAVEIVHANLLYAQPGSKVLPYGYDLGYAWGILVEPTEKDTPIDSVPLVEKSTGRLYPVPAHTFSMAAKSKVGIWPEEGHN